MSEKLDYDKAAVFGHYMSIKQQCTRFLDRAASTDLDFFPQESGFDVVISDGKQADGKTKKAGFRITGNTFGSLHCLGQPEFDAINDKSIEILSGALGEAVKAMESGLVELLAELCPEHREQLEKEHLDARITRIFAKDKKASDDEAKGIGDS